MSNPRPQFVPDSWVGVIVQQCQAGGKSILRVSISVTSSPRPPAYTRTKTPAQVLQQEVERLEARAAMVEEEAARACQLEEEGAAREAHLGVLQDKASGRSRAVAVWGSRGGLFNDSSVLFYG